MMTTVCVNFIYQLNFCMTQNDILYVIDSSCQIRTINSSFITILIQNPTDFLNSHDKFATLHLIQTRLTITTLSIHLSSIFYYTSYSRSWCLQDFCLGLLLSLFTQYLILNFSEYWCLTRNNSSSVIELFSSQN